MGRALVALCRRAPPPVAGSHAQPSPAELPAVASRFVGAAPSVTQEDRGRTVLQYYYSSMS